MDRKQIAGIVVVIVSLLLVTESFYFGGAGIFSGSTSGPKPGTNVSGIAEFNGTIRTYNPLIIIPLNTSTDVISQLKARSDVRAVRNDTQYYLIDTDTRDDVYPIAQFLRTLNVTGYSIANVAASDVIPFTTPLGIVNATVPSGVVQVVTEPLVDSDTEVEVSMVAVVQDGQVIDIRSAAIKTQDLNLQLQAKVASLDHKTYSYVIPWENRTGLNLSNFTSYDFNKLDSIIFTTPLNVSQVIVKKQFSYITYIGTDSAQVDPSFSNASLVAENFADVGYTLPSSSLTILTNDTPELPFNSTVSYSYDLELLQDQTQYKFPTGSFFVETDHELPVNGTITLNISAVGLGDRILAIRSVSPPS